MKFYFATVDEALANLNSSPAGLSAQESAQRLAKNGPNELERAKKKPLLVRFFSQMADPMVLVLAGAAVVSGVFGEIPDMCIILAVIILNSILGVVQEGKAEKAIEALQKMTSPACKVRREGEVLSLPASQLVVGDIVLLEAGDSVPADMRLLESASLKAEEASLTGESVPVDKKAAALPPAEEVSLGDRSNMAYMGSNIVYGRGVGVVTATGMQTEMGKIAHVLLAAEEEKTPLQKKLSQLGKVLSIFVLGICLFIFVFGVLRNGGFQGGHVLELFMTAISLAVAAIPEGLVAVVTIVLSLGVTKMSKRNAIIRRLTAVETLGCTEVICSDKTGTLTQNKMTVVDTFGPKELLAGAMALCSDSRLSPAGEIAGEPTENALVSFALSLNLDKNRLEQETPRVAEAPFDSVRKMMSTVHREGENNRFVQYTKGAPDEVLSRCTQLFENGEILPLTEEKRAAVLAANARMAGSALRVLGAAMRLYSELPDNLEPAHLENGLIFIGLTGMIDPIRPEVKEAIRQCRAAGIRPIMITGDHRDTAVAIALELGIITDPSMAITGTELSQISDADFETAVTKYSVYARVQPEHKVRIVTAWKKLGRITAMTGDGVNDAPAIKMGDIGIAMGITGTDVTKNVSDMVLADDNFATIVLAVEEGRRIYDNIRKAIQFLLATNLSEVVAIFSATLMGVNELLAPIHILWINLVTDSLPAIALGMEPAEDDIMRKKPRSSRDGVFSGGLGGAVIYQGLIFAVLTLLSYFLGNSRSHLTGMTMAFVTLSLCEVFHSLNMRSRDKSIFQLTHQNKFLWGALVLCAVLTLGVVYLPGVNTIFRLEALDPLHFLEATGLAFAVLPIVEMVKLATRFVNKRKQNREIQ